jgi:hypothetical protein
MILFGYRELQSQDGVSYSRHFPRQLQDMVHSLTSESEELVRASELALHTEAESIPVDIRSVIYLYSNAHVTQILTQGSNFDCRPIHINSCTPRRILNFSANGTFRIMRRCCDVHFFKNQ